MTKLGGIIMTTFELNAEIYRNLGIISNDTWKLRQVLEAIKKIIKSNNTKLEFPHLPKDFKITDKTRKGTIGPLPEDVDFDKETARMWEELSK